MRKIFPAIGLLFALFATAPAFAQCAAVPALPDTERRTQYSITASTGPLQVGFQIYGDGTDYANWIGVYLNGTLLSSSAYTVTSATTTLATGCRPITDAVVTFTQAQTGIVQIVGARRPRQTSQFPENRGVAARDLNQRLSDMTAVERERWDAIQRTVQAPPGETLTKLPSASARANTYFAWDGNGNPTTTGATPPVSLPGTTTFTGDVYFKSGRPWVDVRAFGALGDGTTDDTAAIQSAINAAPGGIVFFPPGVYCVKTVGGVSESADLTLLGAGSLRSQLSACGADTTVVTLNSRRAVLSRVAVLGKGAAGDTFGATQTTIVLGSSCTECLLDDLYVAFGAGAFSIAAGDVVIMNVFAGYSYGGAIEANSGGGTWRIRTKYDQSFPTGTPPTGFAAPIPNWAAATAYTLNQVVQTGGYVIQCTQAGTSGGGAPTLANYFVTMTDNTARWQLVGPVTYYGMLLSGTGSQHSVFNHDSVASVTSAIQISGAIESLQVVNSNFGQHFSAAIASTGAGASLQVSNSLVSGGLFTNVGSAINLSSAWAGSGIITGSILWGNVSGTSQWGVVLAGGKGYNITGNSITGFAQAIEIACPITDFVIASNLMGQSTNFGSNTASVKLDAGACDYYNIVNNIVHGLAVSDGGTGIHKTLSGNN